MIRRRNTFKTALACLALLLATATLPLAARAQAVGATLSGLITDPSGALIPKASVIITNPATGVSRQLSTDDKGFYSANNLNPGPYELKVSAPGFAPLVQKNILLTVGASQELDLSLRAGDVSQIVIVTTAAPLVQANSAALGSVVDSRTVRELPINGRDWTSLAALEPGVASVPNQATTGFSANKGNRGFGNQLTDSGHRPNENLYRVNGVIINDYSNAAPGGATGLNLGVDAIQEFSVITSGYTAEYGQTSGAIINGITRSGTNAPHGSAFFFDRDSIFDGRNYFDAPGARPPFRRIQFGGAAGGPIYRDHTFIFGAYEGVRQSQSSSGAARVPDAASRAAAVPAIQPYLALWPVAPAGSPDANGIQTFSISTPTRASENYATVRLDHTISQHDSLAGSYFFDSGPQTQADTLNNTIHQVFSRRQTFGAEESHFFSPTLANTARLGFSRVIGLINAPVSGDAVATNAALAVAPGAAAPPQIPVPGLTTAYGLGGFNRFNHAFNSLQVYDDLFITRGAHSITLGFAFDRIQYNVLEILSPNGRLSTYKSLAAFLANAPTQLNAVAPGQSHEVGLRESVIAAYIQDNWRATRNLTVTAGLRYEIATRPKNATQIPGYTVNGYTVATAGFQQIQTLQNCSASPTACGPVGTDSPFIKNPTLKDFEPRIGLAWDVFGSGKTALRAAGGLFDVLPLPYEFGLNDAATAPFQIIGAAPGSTLGAGINPNVNFKPQSVRNRYIDPNPKRPLVANWNASIQQQLAANLVVQVGYVGSRSVHLSVAADDINLVPSTVVSGIGVVFPCNPAALSPGNTCATQQTGTRVDPNWGSGAGIRPVLFDGASSYNAFQAQVRKAIANGIQGQVSYSLGKCTDLSSAPVTGDTFLNSVAVPLLSQKSTRLGPCDFDIRHVLTGNLVWNLPTVKTSSALVETTVNGWEIGSIVTRQSGAPFTVTVGGGNDPLGTGFNGDFSQATASLLPNCNPIGGGVNYLNTNCFTPPTAPTSFAAATAANPYGCAPGGYARLTAPSGQQFCSNVQGNTTRNQFSGPGFVTLDLSLFKNTPVRRISETFSTQFRVEFFNILNHTNYLSPGFLNGFGQNNSVYDVDGTTLPTSLNQTSTSSRQIQLGCKLLF